MNNFLESFNRTKSLMTYDVSKTVTENLFTEQKPNFSGYDTLNPMNPNYGKKSEGGLSFDIHDWFTLVQVTLLILGFATAGTTSVIAFALGATVDIVEAGIFLAKGDPYMGTVMLILSIFGINDLMKIPIVKKYGIEGTKQLVRKYKSGGKLSSTELDDLKKLGEYISKGYEEFIPLLKKSVKMQVIKYLSKKSMKWLLNLIIILNKGKLPLLIAGTWIFFDHFYIYVFREDIKKMKLRNENAFIQIIQLVESQLSGEVVDKLEFIKSNIPIDSNTFNNDLYKIDTTKINMDSINTAILKRNGIL